MLTKLEWHARFTQQARWTQDLRRYLFQRAGIENARRVLEVGCGTGAILSELLYQIPFQAGLDIDRTYLDLAIRNSPEAKLTQGDAYLLPYPRDFFDFTFCHFLLLWVNDPLKVLGEMRRVTRPDGAVMALAEPDYGGRIDYPDKLALLGEWQIESLKRQGADPLMGRKLTGLFHKTGLESVETGVLGGQWSESPDWAAWESEWAVLESDLKKTFQDFESWKVIKDLDKSAYEKGERVLFVPTFYALGFVSQNQ
jgi:SAM-dependent methyltransferase